MRAAKNISKRMTWVIASLVLVISQITPVILTTGSAKAAAYELGSASGIWTDTDGGSGITGINTNEVRWGTPANTENKKSGLKFVGSTNQTFNEGDKFLLGDLTHYNWPVAGGTAADGATLKIVLDFNTPAISPDPDFTYDFVIDETTNSNDNCPSWQITNTPCDDMISFPNSYGSKSFTIGDKLYTLKIEGFTNCGAGNTPVSQFITEEKKDSKACLYGSLSSVLVNSPQLTLVEKAVNGNDADVAPGPTLYVGDTASFTYKVQNTGNVTMTNIAVVDNKGVAVTCPMTTLTAGELMTCTGSSAVVAGQYTNIAHATGKYNNQTYTSNTEPANYKGIPKPGNLTVTKVVVNDDGGTAVVANFPLFVNGSPVTSGQSYSYAAGTYTITETQKTGYEQTTLGGNCSKQQGSIKVTVPANGNVTCTITNNDKAPELTLKKKVTNNNGGTATASNWTVTATPAQNSVGAVVISGNGSNGVNDRDAKANVAYTLSETGPSGYTFVKWTCDGGTLVGNVLTLGLDEEVECEVENNDNAPSLTLVKSLIKDNGGTANATDWTLKAVGTGGTPTNLSGVTGSAGATSGATFKADTYTLSETGGPTGYTKSNWTCTNDVTVTSSKITLAPGQTTICTITNNDDTPALTLIKKLGETYGSNVKTTDWTLTATGALDPSTDLSGATGTAGATSGATFKADTYTLGETGPTGFTSSWNCVGGTLAQQAVAIALGQTVTCTVTNTAIQPKLTVTKIVENGTTGSTKGVSDFPLNVSGTPVTSGVTKGFNVGNYTVGEVTDPGYKAAVTGNCNEKGEVSLALADVKSCTITNTAIAPTLTVKKIAKNDNGGTKTSDEFKLYANGNQLTGGSTTTDGTTTTTTYVVANPTIATPYTLSEATDDGYTATDWTCTGNSIALDGSKVSLKLAENVTCTITNDDDSASLTLIKKVVDNYGYGANASDWTLTASGPTDLSGAGGVDKTNVKAGDYTLGETTQKWSDKYWDSEWSCEGGGELVGQALAIALAQNVSCTVTNTMKGATIIINKVVINDDDGESTAGDFSVSVNEGESIWFDEDSEDELLGQIVLKVPAGTYQVIEDQEDENGYFTVYENDCDDDDDWDWDEVKSSSEYEEDCFPGDCEELVVGVGETITCTITNDDEGEGTGRSVDLSVEKDDKGAIAQANGTFDYGIFVRNNGNTTAYNVVMEDAIPSTIKVNSISAGDWDCVVTGADVNGYGGTLTCTLPSLNGGDYADSIILNVTVANGAQGVIENTACVDSTQRDYNTENNCDTEETPIESIKVVKTGPATANAGDTVTYTFTVTNTGETPLSGVTVVDNIAGNAVYQSGDVNNNDVLEQDETWIFTANYTIPANATNQVNNTAIACGSTFFIEDEELEYSDNIQSLRLNLIVIDNPTPVTPVCDDDLHTLTVNEVLVDTGNPVVLTSVIAFAMILGALYMAVPQKRDLTSRK